jgi:hypothetical protein
MDDRLAKFAVNVNQRKPVNQALRRGVVPQCPRVDARPTSSPPLRVEALRRDLHDNFVGQGRRSPGATMDDRLAKFAVNVNQRKPANQALRRGVVP